MLLVRAPPFRTPLFLWLFILGSWHSLNSDTHSWPVCDLAIIYIPVKFLSFDLLEPPRVVSFPISTETPKRLFLRPACIGQAPSCLEVDIMCIKGRVIELWVSKCISNALDM